MDVVLVLKEREELRSENLSIAEGDEGIATKCAYISTGLSTEALRLIIRQGKLLCLDLHRGLYNLIPPAALLIWRCENRFYKSQLIKLLKGRYCYASCCGKEYLQSFFLFFLFFFLNALTTLSLSSSLR